MSAPVEVPHGYGFVMDLAVVAVVSSQLEAEVIASRLRSEGIDAAVFGDMAGGAEPQLAMVRGVRVAVRPDDEAVARAILDLDAANPLDHDDRLTQPFATPVAIVVIAAVIVVGMVAGIVRFLVQSLP